VAAVPSGLSLTPLRIIQKKIEDMRTCKTKKRDQQRSEERKKLEEANGN
jgi:hypothetical protein